MADTSTWMPLYIGEYLRDTGHLTTAEHGAYMLLLMQAWARGGELPADDEQLRRLTRMEAKDWRRSKATLMAFFRLDGGVWRHKRIDHELARSRENIAQRSAAGKASAEARKRQRDSNERSTSVATDVTTTVDTSVPTNVQQKGRTVPSPSPEETSSLRSDVSSAKRGARLPDDWEPRSEEVAFAANEGVDCMREVAKFRDYWRAASGQNARKLDWDAAFRNWLRNAPRGGKRTAPASKLSGWYDVFGLRPGMSEEPILDGYAEIPA